MRKPALCICENKDTDQLWDNQRICYYIDSTICLLLKPGSAVAWWLLPRTPDSEVGGSSPTGVKPCCVLEQGTFTPQKVLVIPWKRWLRPNITEKMFTGTLRINQPTNLLKPPAIFCGCTAWFVSDLVGIPRREVFSRCSSDCMMSPQRMIH